ncbi:MAG: 23S rRNA (uracil(1939)-C(5))-methyltransferase RlmD [Bacteroidota bacterium]|nr:23S rRNA (uracil(1939)-C(5))-methyltransferase RlmD [Candidatus Kapabacteria bacterium]MCS7303285.1 23S rRNA (uracil(1939)-C(5))-methyltransferase RlmD [Candidatus Kapabacteria bacterium]MDW8075049.1 23S rRNA (uracil(1939)-C(5))-methyltransferase RlmD [Bacteroidota bacterium]MDW8271688.1 23S rRNA (uracil(1939)-C(5))-methyltransferase RlmD [Bacteroidota bacterium]
MKQAEVVELTVEALGFEGIAIARLDSGMVVHLRGALPGERVRAVISKHRRNYVEAQVLEILQPSPERRQPPCPYAGDCGGCTWQHATYREQLRWKQQHVRDAFERIGGIQVHEYRPILASPQEFGYRAKMEFTCSDRTWIPERLWKSLEPTAMERKRSAIGLHVRGKFDAVLDIERCLLQDDTANTAYALVRQLARSKGISCYNLRTRQGFLRNVVIRRTSIGETMVALVTQSPTSELQRAFIEECGLVLCTQVPTMASVIWAINDTPSPVAPGPYTVVAGRSYIREQVKGIEFQISAPSFFQANLWQLERFVTAVAEAAALSPDDQVWDLYAGAGTLTLPLARQCKQIVGIESNSAATADARANAERNGITNATFLTADLHQRQSWQLLDDLWEPDVVVVDPPRAGIHPIVVDYLLHRCPKRIVYVSCNPATQARDVALLQKRYHVSHLQPVDMFPQTYHIENIALLQRL